MCVCVGVFVSVCKRARGHSKWDSDRHLAVRSSVLPSSDLGLQQLQEEFVHWDFAVLLDAVEVLHSFGGGLAEEGEGHEQLAGPAGILLVLGSLVVLQGLVEHILELLHCIHVFNMHGV